MANGLKIDTARLISSGETIKLSSFDEKERNNIKCEFCNARLKYTKGYWRNKGHDDQLWVKPFFSLSPGEEHSLNCRNTIESTIEYFVNQSESVENIDETALFKGETNIEFRIHVLAESLKVEKETIDLIENNAGKTGTKPQTTGKHLSSYLKTAKGLAKIWSYIQDSSDRAKFKDRIVLKFKGEKIPWGNFVFETKNLDTLLSKKLYYPIALILETKSNELSKNERQLQHCIKCHAKVSDDIIIVPRIYYNGNPNMLLPNYQYLIIAYISLFKGDKNFHNLNVFVHHPSQIALLTNEEIPNPD
jgi:hypothetical protein